MIITGVSFLTRVYTISISNKKRGKYAGNVIFYL